MSESLYTTEVPDSGLGDNADLGGGGHGGCTGATFVFAVDGSVLGVGFYAPTTVAPTDTYTAELWLPTGTDGTTNGTGTGTLIRSKSVAGSSLTAGTWNAIMFDTPVSVSANTPYRHVLHNTAGRYVAIVGYYATDHTNGNVTGFQSGHNYGGSVGTLQNNVFFDGCDAGTYPNKFFNTPSYLVDTVFQANVSATDLVVQSAAQTQAASNLTLIQTHVLTVDSAVQLQTADTVVLGATGLPPPASRIEVIAVATRRESISAANRTEHVTL